MLSNHSHRDGPVEQDEDAQRDQWNKAETSTIYMHSDGPVEQDEDAQRDQWDKAETSTVCTVMDRWIK